MKSPKLIENLYESAGILEKVAANENGAVKACLEKYGGFVYSLAKKFTDSHEDAEDAAQDIFLDLWKCAARFDKQKSSEIGFIALVSKRRLIDNYRKTKKFSNAENYDESELSSNNSVEVLDFGFDVKDVMVKLNNLKPAQKNMIKMAFYDGISHVEISRLTETPLGTVKSNIRRGLQIIKKELNLEENRSAYKAALQVF